MGIKVKLRHQSHYRFDRSVSASPHEIRLRPAPHARTPVSAYSLNIHPKEHFIHWQQDAFGNFVARVTFPEPIREIDIRVELLADMTVINPFDFFVEASAEHYPFEYPSVTALELAPFLFCEKGDEEFLDFIAQIRADIPKGMTTTHLLVHLNQLIQARIQYMIRLEPGVQSIEQTLKLGSGSCRDSAWLLAQVLRHLGIATRFVSGYLIQLVPDLLPPGGAEGPRSDFTDLHAWCEAYIPGAGWIGMDATSGLLAGEGHIPLAVSSLPTAAAPVIGLTDLCESRLDFVMELERVVDEPRVSKPYSESAWMKILALGEQIDASLLSQDVRLTQGGEPTFVSIENQDAAEWNTAALGEEKQTKALAMQKKLAEAFAPGALFHFGQGKWYPGEPLPRWSYNLFWRVDGKPLWPYPELIADGTSSKATPEITRSFVDRLARALGIEPQYVIEAFEDPWHALDEESRVPHNIDPLAEPLDDPKVRSGLARRLREGLCGVKGYVIPIKPSGQANLWRSSPWPLRQKRLYLVPGDSPMGLRLPLSSLPWVLPEQFEPSFDRDPFESRGPLDLAGDSETLGQQTDPPSKGHEEIIHTALSVELREGILHVFLPPLTHLEDFVSLIDGVAQTSRGLAQPIRIEGYPPPKDSRIHSLSVTPDPGVIEVNIHPSPNFTTLKERTMMLYRLARETGLCAEKFMIDGRHTGTGGGNHITLGGREAADSPFLRRPDLLVSLIRYWQQHPSLSYLFSGQFIGPTSQSPRVDEARDDNLYELEIAFQQIDALIDSGKECQKPWLVDRLLRNLLIDMTGNTHRAEFCIDKLYSPDTPTGRLGLVELRAFEMPPHPQMSVVQSLLLRALISIFWERPHKAPLIYWDTELHDRFMLPHFVEKDLEAVLHDLEVHGCPFEREWLAPFLDFRFPFYGKLTVDGVEISLRQAIEPWHVLGEEVAQGGTARYVDSSVERLEVSVRGLLSHRHAVLCNGRALPLHPTGTPGEFVAGVRFKAWAPHSALHPGIKVQAPLVFELFDRLQNLSLGGLSYHVSHPGGRNYETFPVNAQEAEARRRARFVPHGRWAGDRQDLQAVRNHRFPMTLDLRFKAQGG